MKYPLTVTQKKTIQTWLSKKDKPLFIQGSTGIGKSTIAMDLLKDTHIVHINSDHLKYSKNLIDEIKNSLFKKDIMMMCSKNHYKSLLIDDLHLFIKYDKSVVSKLIDFLKTIHTNHLVVVVSEICIHKLITSLENISYCINYKPSSSYFKKKYGSEIQDTNIHSIKYKSSGLIDTKDKIYTLDEIYPQLLSQKTSLEQLFRLVGSDFNILTLNLLENTPSILKKITSHKLYDIYKNYCLYDMYEYKYINKDIDIDILRLFSCVIPSYHLKQSIKPINKYKFKYNSYISKSLIQINNQSLLTDFDYIKFLHLLYLSQTKDTIQEAKQMISFYKPEIKTLEKQIKVYNYYYNKQLNRKIVNKILKTSI